MLYKKNCLPNRNSSIANSVVLEFFVILQALEKKKIEGSGRGHSIDALSVGFTLAEYSGLMAFVDSPVIAVLTFVICMAGPVIGKKFGTKLSGKA